MARSAAFWLERCIRHGQQDVVITDECAQVAAVHSAALPGLMAQAALRLLASALTPEAPSGPVGQLGNALLSLLSLLRLLLPLLSSAEAATLLPQARPRHSGGGSKSAGRSRMPSPERTANAGARSSNSAAPKPASDSPIAGPLTGLMLCPMQHAELSAPGRCSVAELECAGELAQRAAELLVAAAGGGDPRDELLERLLPLWLSFFACTPPARAAYGDDASAQGREPHTEQPERRYWAIARVLYSHVTATVGTATAHAVLEGWPELERGLQERAGWTADAQGGAAAHQLALRHSLQVCRHGCALVEPCYASHESSKHFAVFNAMI